MRNLKNPKNLSNQDQIVGMARSTKELSLDDFYLIKVIGKGGFGKVYLGKHKKSKKEYALKVFDKQSVIEDQMAKDIYKEKNI